MIAVADDDYGVLRSRQPLMEARRQRTRRKVVVAPVPKMI